MDYITSVLELLGIYNMGKNPKLGSILFIAGGMVWTIYVLVNRIAYGTLLFAIPAIGLNIRNLIVFNKKVGDNGNV